MQLFDAFISHASEDKDEFVRPLAQRLEEAHISVWFDEFTLKAGDSLRRSIDRGLAQSQFGVVVLSPSFFAKEWPQRELDGLVARETVGGQRIILPIWHRISKVEVCQHSPTLADVIAIPSEVGLDKVVERLRRVIRPQGSPLIVARDRLIDFGLEPPVVTDQWWLDVVEATSWVTPWGFAIQERSWGRWSFPLPSKNDTADDRGERLAWAAMQMRWEEAAEKQRVTQITPPEDVLRFIASQAGLTKTAHDFPVFLASYAPQLTIPGFGGDFEADFDELLADSMKKRASAASGSGLTTTRHPPGCDEYIALRHPHFGYYRAGSIACQFVQGDLGGPPCRAYHIFDYLIWLLSEKSRWLPPRIRRFLTQGMREWTAWLWTGTTNEERESGLTRYPELGTFAEAIASRPRRRWFTKTARTDLVRRVAFSREILDLPEPTSRLVRRFLDNGFIEAYFKRQKEIEKRRKK